MKPDASDYSRRAGCSLKAVTSRARYRTPRPGGDLTARGNFHNSLDQFSFACGSQSIKLALLKRKSRPQKKPVRSPQNPTQPGAGAKSHAPPEPSASRRRLFRVASLTLIPALILIGFELCLRLAGYGYPTQFFLPSHIGERDVFIENSQFGRRFFPRQLVRRPPPVVLEREKSEKGYRIFILGESAAMGDPDPSFSFGRILKVLFQERFPGTEFEMVNTAFTAINSHVILPIARECARQNGDLWIIYMGNNEVAGPFGPATVFGSQSKSLSLIRAGIALKGFKTGQFLESVQERLFSDSNPTKEWGGLQMFLENQIQKNDPKLNRVYDGFRANLENILELGVQSGAKVIVSTVASNLKDCPPFSSAHSPNLRGEGKSAWTAIYQRGIENQSAGRYAQALEEYSAAAKIDPDFAELHFRVGQVYANLGKTAEARRSFELSRDLDTLRLRTDTSLNAIIAEAAANRSEESVRLVNAAEALQNAASDHIPGDEFFFDHVHLTFSGNYQLALAVAEATLAVLPDALLQQGADQWISENDCGSKLALTGWNQIQLLDTMRQRLSEAPFTNQLNHAVRQQQFREKRDNLQPMLQAGALDQAEETFAAAMQTSPRDFHLKQNFSNFLYARNDVQGAITQAKQVIQLLPHNSAMHYNLGIFQNASGDAEEAEQQFLRSLELNPDYALAYDGLGKAQVKQGRNDDAIGSFSKALLKNPKDLEALLSLSQLWQQQGNLQKAREYILKGLEIHPNSFAIQMQMGDLVGKEGDLLQATKHYGDAVHLDPDAALTYFADQAREKPNDAKSHFFLANAMAARNERVASLDLLKKAVELDADFWEARYFLGVELATQDRIDEARSQFSAVVKSNPDFALGHLNLGVAHAKARQWNQAREAFQKTLRLDPTNKQAPQYLDTIEKMLR